MSYAAHEPRRVGPSRADSPSGSKVTPRRNASEISEPHGIQYDSDELPVLIRLPDLRDLGSLDSHPASSTQKKRHRIDRPSTNKQSTRKQDTSRVSKKSFRQQAGDNKLVISGIFGGILIVVILLLINASDSTPTTDQDGWANNDVQPELLIEEPEISIPAANEPPPLYPGFAYEAPEPVTETAQIDSDEAGQTPIGVPDYEERPAARPTEAIASPNKPSSIDGWPSEETMGSPSAKNSRQADFWPGEGLSLEQSGGSYVPINPPSQGDYRSSMYPTASDSYRTGKLDLDRPQPHQGNRDSILDGNIEPPDPTSLR